LRDFAWAMALAFHQPKRIDKEIKPPRGRGGRSSTVHGRFMSYARGLIRKD
jgi:hypothetical protein